MRKLTISRTKKFSGSAATIEIYINDACYAQLKNGERITLDVENTRLRVQGISEMLVQGSGFGAAGGKTCKGNVIIVEEGEEDVFLDLDMKSNLSGLLPTLSKGGKTEEGTASKPQRDFKWSIFLILLVVFFPAAIVYWITKN